MTFVLSSVDYSDRVLVSGYTVTPRKVKGSSAGELLNGETLEDLIVVKTDLSISFCAMEESDVSKIAYACSGEYVTLRFSDPILGTDYEGTYIPTINGIEMAIDQANDWGNKRFYYGFQVSFKEK